MATRKKVKANPSRAHERRGKSELTPFQTYRRVQQESAAIAPLLDEVEIGISNFDTVFDLGCIFIASDLKAEILEKLEALKPLLEQAREQLYFEAKAAIKKLNYATN